jgi:hypothetical protein
VDPVDLWWFLPVGYLVTVLIETPVLLLGLSARHPLNRRLAAGLWLTVCTYPIVVLVLPLLIGPTAPRAAYLGAAEVFAPMAECALFWYAFGRKVGSARDGLAIVAANLASFGVGEWLNAADWFGVLG